MKKQTPSYTHTHTHMQPYLSMDLAVWVKGRCGLPPMARFLSKLVPRVLYLVIRASLTLGPRVF